MLEDDLREFFLLPYNVAEEAIIEMDMTTLRLLLSYAHGYMHAKVVFDKTRLK